MEFHVSRTENEDFETFKIERDIDISVDLRDYENGSEVKVREIIHCTRYTYYVTFSKMACRARYGEKTQVGQENGKAMILSVVVPDTDYITTVGNGALYSFLPTQLKLNVPIVCHVPFKLDASREFVDPQDNNLWFKEASNYLSELIEKVYLDYCHKVKENIVRYLPDKNKSLFAINNGKEECLTEQKCFNGAHYLDLPIFYTVDNNYKKSDEIFCFSESENIDEPEKVYRLMENQNSLFLSPIPVGRFSIKIATGIKRQMFKQALNPGIKSSAILDYLDSVNYDYPENLIREFEPINITQAQLENIIKHKRLLKALRTISSNDIKNNKRFKLEITDGNFQAISDLFDDEFEMSDIPEAAKKYLSYCNNKCLCLDEKDDFFLPCHNVLLLSANNPLSSFASFCYVIDEKDTFSILIKMREASKELDHYENGDCSDEEYLRRLCNIRKIIKESLGKDGYRSYLDIILKSGTDRSRFIQELLQNADDCLYDQEVTPTFSLSINENTIITEYNETGFTRANIRSITAIGESTKNKLLSNNNKSIGEKGVGFKTIFAISSKITIHSGNYHFSLSDKEPTIPRVINDAGVDSVSGTKMEIELKGGEAFPTYKEKDILELCLCLRNLKKLTIGKHNVTINDTDDKRTITIGSRNYVFKCFHHDFTIVDEATLEERMNWSRVISADQQIVFFVPEFSIEKNYYFPLYCGLPTKHKIRIPIAIDAPFSLTTSREEIETEGSKWNNIIRREIYAGLIDVIDSLKKDERSKVFRFLRFIPRFQGAVRVYVNETFDNRYLNEYDFLAQLQRKEIIPTYNNDVFAVPIQHTAYRFPEAAIYIIRKLSLSKYEGIDSSSVIDKETGDYDSVLNAFACEDAKYSTVLPIIFKYAERFIRDEGFRTALYEYLEKANNEFIVQTHDEYIYKIKDLKIIPVYGIESGATEYISWKEDSIFVKPSSTRSEDNYYVLNEKLLPKSKCEKIYSANINEMSIEYEHSRYNAMLKEIINSGKDITSIYKYIIAEYKAGRLTKNDSFGLLRANHVPLKNALGQITMNKLFTCEQEKQGYFTTKLLMEITVHEECRSLAMDLCYQPLNEIHYDDLRYYEELTQDEVEELLDDPDHYFINYEELLRNFYRAGLLSDALLQEYNLEYLSYGGYDTASYSFEFPSEQAGNRVFLAKHIRKLWKAPAKIITVEEMKKVQKIKTHDNQIKPYDRKYSRESMLNRYAPEERSDLCFCQMCLVAKNKNYIEVNNIENTPEYFFSELRITLCLECSKKFEALRHNDSIRKAFIERILDYDIYDESTVKISIGSGDTITFTAKHLAEIQEILKQKPKSHK
ncbi:MAG TPA: hypothetical protein OIL93_10260 [Oscillospiraceae bacterium]|nr:hypothetical protein [Oscillospiraceae bacterium]